MYSIWCNDERDLLLLFSSLCVFTLSHSLQIRCHAKTKPYVDVCVRVSVCVCLLVFHALKKKKRKKKKMLAYTHLSSLLIIHSFSNWLNADSRMLPMLLLNFFASFPMINSTILYKQTY